MPPQADSVLARLRELPIDAPPALTITDFERRSRRRRSRRRARRVGASLALFAFAAGALTFSELQEGEAEVATVTRASLEESAPGAPKSAPALHVEPIEGGLAVKGSGFAPETDVAIRQCQADTEDRCDVARGVVVRANSSGEVQVSLHVFNEVLIGREWADCVPCELRAQDAAGSVAASTGPWPGVARDGRPSVAIVEDGPYALGSLVALTGSGYQIGAQDVAFPWCQASSGEDWLECVYGPSSRVTVDESGRFEARGFALPSGDYFRDRGFSEVILAWVPAVGAAPAAAVTLQLSGDNLQATGTR